MKIRNSKLFWSLIFLILLVLVALVSMYIGRNFTGSGLVPTRSAFAGRLPGLQEGDMSRFQFFYATNRENSKDTFNARGNILGNNLTTGTFDVLISPYRDNCISVIRMLCCSN